jgi:NAD(P)-dependent dehydrogenase (short-subunit alcohol dehydrogenase family)
LDLSSFRSIENFVNQLRTTAKGHTIDVLINNAGIFSANDQYTEDGFKEVMVNTVLIDSFFSN